MASLERQTAILSRLGKLRGLSALKDLTVELNYDLVNRPLPTLSPKAKEKIVNDPILLATGGSNNDFHIVYTQLSGEKLLRGVERDIITKLLVDNPYALFVFSNQEQDHWHFVNVKYEEAEKQRRRLLRRIVVGGDERLRTASERIAMLDVEEAGQTLFGVSALQIQTQHDKAFDVDKVTKQFFDEYKAVFNILQDDLARQTKDKRWAHDYALQFLNRCMFIYFIQRKRWLGSDTEFLRAYWSTYQKTHAKKDEFFEKWLKVLFFEAFNNKKTLLNASARSYLPEGLRDILWRAPYLNGGLFSENELDNTTHDFNVSDDRFKQVFQFLERYNFTIAEDSPLDQEVAVDPEMIGKVYESLVNVSTEADERGDAGIFYTPRVEIDLMCRLTLVDHLANSIGVEHKTLIYELVFALEPEEKQQADKAVRDAGLWQKIEERLCEVTAVDPACGSGSFLVGMLHVLDDLQCRAAMQTKTNESAFERKKRIIGQSLYGVDVMKWAAQIAELRMWLALISDANFEAEELYRRDEPLLPHFSFKIRSGDSLVQEIGGVSLNNLRRDLRADNLSSLQARITNLKNEKAKFYRNDKTCKYKTDRQLQTAELELFREIVETHHNSIQNRIKQLKNILDSPLAAQIGLLDGRVKEKPQQRNLSETDKRRELEQLEEELVRVKEAREKLKTVHDVPFAWDIAFVEVFSGDRKGFDLVIGNPPYVRQENIADPRLPREKITTENKKIYKAKLQREVYEAYPNFFGYNKTKVTAKHKLDAKSDLYIYFFFLTLQLLNDKGAFSFITSNSWLDVGYGADLQEFLLKRCYVKFVIDNSVKRSFESADVNTVITLLSPPAQGKNNVDDANNKYLDHVTRFVMFQTGFENTLSPVLFEEIEEAQERKRTLEYRAFPITQRDLLEDGLEKANEDEETEEKPKSRGPLIKVAHYVGNKWGGKYLRAPDIYWTIIDKGSKSLVRLGDTAEVKRGITTGANEFFYLEEEDLRQWKIESEFLKKAIKSPRENKSISIKHEFLKSKIFICNKDKKDLKGTVALEYIKWGETQGFHLRPTCATRTRWWSLGERRMPNLCFSYLIDSTARTLLANQKCLSSDNFQDVFVDRNLLLSLCASLNSTVFQLMVNVAGRANFGGGLMKIQTYEVCDLLCVKPDEIEFEDETILKNENWDVLKPTRERQQLDKPIFDALRLTKGERDAVYEAVIELVEARLNKATSLNPKKDGMSKRLAAVERTQGIWQDVPEFEEMEE